jgi:hypothetical protein
MPSGLQCRRGEVFDLVVGRVGERKAQAAGDMTISTKVAKSKLANGPKMRLSESASSLAPRTN